MADFESLKKMKVADLKKELATLGLPTKGLKPELLQRLEQHLQEQAEVDELIGNDGLNGDEEGMVDVGDEETGGVEEEQDKGDKDLLEDVEKPKKSMKSLPIESPVLMTTEEKRLARSKRFGVEISSTDKKAARGLRFGTGSSSVTGTPESDKLKQRGMRFGIQQSGGVQSDVEDRIKKRQERFGIVTPSSKPKVAAVKLKHRQERFGSNAENPELEAKKKKRAERFGNA